MYIRNNCALTPFLPFFVTPFFRFSPFFRKGNGSCNDNTHGRIESLHIIYAK